MSDYLGNLLERSFAPLRQLQPRMPSLFETPFGAGLVETPTVLESAAEKVAPASPQNPEPSKQEPPRLDRPEQPANKSNPPQPTNRPESGQPNSLQPIVAASLADVGVLKVHSSDRTEKAAPITIAHAQPLNSPSTLSHAQSEPVVRRAARTEADPVVPRSETPPRPSASTPPAIQSKPRQPEATVRRPDPVRISAPAPLLPTTRNDHDAPRIIVLPDPGQRASKDNSAENGVASHHSAAPPPTPAVSANGITVRSARPAREAVTPFSMTAGRNDSRRQPPAAEPAPLPSIHVTIGRVEVRATPPPVASARPRAKKETEMSLETYLQRRAEGVRR